MKSNWRNQGILKVCILGAMLSATPAFPLPITFNLRDATATAEIESGSITRDGVIATLLASGGSLNQGSGGFGVNAPGSGDVADRLDVEGESISIGFNTDVLLKGLSLSVFSPGESASLAIAGFATRSLSDTGAGTDVYSFSTDNLVLAGQTVVLSWVGGNGFSFDSFQIESRAASASAVPDSSATLPLAMLALGAVAMVRRRLA